MMRAITIRQPWGWAVAAGYKPVENRGRQIPWSSAVGQDLAVHVGKGWDDDDLHDPRIQRALMQAFPNPDPLQRVHTWQQHLADVVLPALHELDGTIVAVGELTGVHWWQTCSNPAGGYRPCSMWAQDNSWHLSLPTVTRLPEPVQARGLQGLWSLTHDVEAQVRAQLTKAAA